MCSIIFYYVLLADVKKEKKFKISLDSHDDNRNCLLKKKENLYFYVKTVAQSVL